VKWHGKAGGSGVYIGLLHQGLKNIFPNTQELYEEWGPNTPRIVSNPTLNTPPPCRGQDHLFGAFSKGPHCCIPTIALPLSEAWKSENLEHLTRAVPRVRKKDQTWSPLSFFPSGPQRSNIGLSGELGHTTRTVPSLFPILSKDEDLSPPSPKTLQSLWSLRRIRQACLFYLAYFPLGLFTPPNTCAQQPMFFGISDNASHYHILKMLSDWVESR
jgi:hypothetical protein